MIIVKEYKSGSFWVFYYVFMKWIREDITWYSEDVIRRIEKLCRDQNSDFIHTLACKILAIIEYEDEINV